MESMLLERASFPSLGSAHPVTDWNPNMAPGARKKNPPAASPGDLFKESLERLCRERNVSRQQLRDALDVDPKVSVSKATVNRWFAGTNLPDIAQAYFVARLFNVSMEELVGQKAYRESDLDSEEIMLLKLIRRMGSDAALGRLLDVKKINSDEE